jgi:hypothetical protein
MKASPYSPRPRIGFVVGLLIILIAVAILAVLSRGQDVYRYTSPYCRYFNNDHWPFVGPFHVTFLPNDDPDPTPPFRRQPLYTIAIDPLSPAMWTYPKRIHVPGDDFTIECNFAPKIKQLPNKRWEITFK